ncbi:hypothetical protein J6590_053687 [Homalodisca vitripennis]|nr:hypothetical protein J6590_053687 [Homalodisca vitripennis]
MVPINSEVVSGKGSGEAVPVHEMVSLADNMATGLGVAPNIAAQLYCQIVSTKKRARRKNVPPIPTDYRQLNEYMNEEDLDEKRFSDDEGTHNYHTVLGEEDTCTVFVVKPVIEVLKHTKEMHIYGTFKIVPSQPTSN